MAPRLSSETRTFGVADVVGMLQQWYAGRSLREISASLDVDRKTLRKYIGPAAAAGIAPGGQAKSREEWAELVRGWFPELADTRLRHVDLAGDRRAPRVHPPSSWRPGWGCRPSGSGSGVSTA